jgi:hypothetical protein
MNDLPLETTDLRNPPLATSQLIAGVVDTLEERVGGRQHIRHLECRPSMYRSSFLIEDIDVELDDGSRLELVAKPTAWSAMCPEARAAKPSFACDEERECSVYELILPNLDVSAVRYYGSFVGHADVRFLLLERSEGTPLWQVGDFEAWREAARWLARLHTHARRAGVHRGHTAEHLLRYNREFYDCWMRRALEFRMGTRKELEQLDGIYTRVVNVLLAQPLEFIHGEYDCDNILVERRADVPFCVRAVDWEMAAVAPPLIDLATLLCGNWTDEARAEMADAYHSACAEYGSHVLPRDRYLKTLDCCLIHLAVKNLGWSGAWTPPARSAHDWLGEALRLGEKWQL